MTTSVVPAVSPAPDASRAAAGAVALAVLQVLGRGLAFLFVIVATRAVLPSEFGRYSIVAGLVAFAGFVADFGSTTVITRRVSRAPESSDELLAGTLVASIAVGLVAYAVVVATLALGPYPTSLARIGAVGALAIPLDAALTSMLAAMDGHGLISRRALVTFARLAVVAGGGTIAVLVTGSISLAIVMIAVGPAVGCAFALVYTRRYAVWTLALRPHWGESVRLFRSALPYALLGGIGAIVARLDLLVLSWLTSPADVAPYDLALRAIEAATALGMVVGGPALYILSRRLGAGDPDGARRAYEHAVRIGYLIGLPLAAVFVGLHDPITRLVFGSEFADAAPLLAMLGASVAFSVLGWVQGAVVLAGGEVRRALRAFIVVLAVAAGLDVVLIPTYGAEGAAVATVMVAVVVCVVFDRLNRRTLGMSTPYPGWALVGSSVAGAAAMLAAASVGRGGWGFLAAALLPLLLVATGVVTRHDLHRLRDLVARGNRV